MTDKIDEIFESMEKSYNDYIMGKFICDKCKQERPTYRSVILVGSPLKSITGFTRVCEHCYWEIYKELKGEKDNNDFIFCSKCEERFNCSETIQKDGCNLGVKGE